MKIETLKLGPLDTNCYIISSGSEAIIIDPAADAESIIKHCENLKVKEVLVTHHHFDHIGALSEIEEYYGLEHNKFKHTFGYEVIKTPGHTEDSISFYFKDEHILFGGDFIFFHSIGRFDFPESSEQHMKKSIEMIKKYPDNIIVYPGHGPSTILGKEKTNFSYYFNN